MTATSHAITGAVVAIFVKEPLLVVPLALLSHFVCDALPHTGIGDIASRLKRQTAFRWLCAVDALLLVSFFTFLIIIDAPAVVYLGAIVAGSPDLIWAYLYIVKEKGRELQTSGMNIFNRFHARIQWSETFRFGIPVEIVYSSLLLSILVGQL